ncbi:hypothetical protein [Pseudomonas sp. DSP3-2-2]|uniref:hypothetical protein n=1 Tax=unclassified Pseudomonas TaxID=196821 RepID=UPI003CF19BE1
MKVRALSRISGPMDVKDPGEEFVVDAATGADLIGRRAVEEVALAVVELAADALAPTIRKKTV